MSSDDVVTGRISVHEQDVAKAKGLMADALRSVARQLPGAEFKEVYSRAERWGPRDPGDLRNEALQVMVDNNAMCKPVPLPEDLADEL